MVLFPGGFFLEDFVRVIFPDTSQASQESTDVKDNLHQGNFVVVVIQQKYHSKGRSRRKTYGYSKTLI